jgi:DNA adenine methylase
MKPLFMWAGGKNKMLKHYKDELPASFDTYIEPFFGGGAVFLKAAQINPKAKFVINDVNEYIIDIYRSVKSDLQTFTDKLDTLSDQYLPLSKADRKKFYFDLRKEYAFDYKNWTKTEESAVLYFLMKTGFNGIWQINKNTNNRFGTPAGLLDETTEVYNKDNVKKWHDLLQNTTILCGDYKQVLSHVTPNSWVFMDPPYRGGFTKYATNFDDDMQKEVVDFAEACRSAGAESWITNRDLGDQFFENYLIEKQYNMLVKTYDVTYTAGRRKKTATGFEAKKAKEFLIIGR